MKMKHKAHVIFHTSEISVVHRCFMREEDVAATTSRLNSFDINNHVFFVAVSERSAVGRRAAIVQVILRGFRPSMCISV